jgi:putative ABC transport system permease protein
VILPWLEEIWRDLRFAMRSLCRTPGFTSIALLVIAVGIGVNTAVFSVVDAVLLKPLTYPDPQTLVRVVTIGNRGPIPVASIPSTASGGSNPPCSSRWPPTIGAAPE